MIELLIGIVLGVLVGAVAMRMYTTHYEAGNLFVCSDEDGEHLFVELNKPVSYICKNDFATFRITRK